MNVAHTSNVGGGGGMGRKSGGKKKPRDPTELMDYMVGSNLETIEMHIICFLIKRKRFELKGIAHIGVDCHLYDVKPRNQSVSGGGLILSGFSTMYSRYP